MEKAQGQRSPQHSLRAFHPSSAERQKNCETSRERSRASFYSNLTSEYEGFSNGVLGFNFLMNKLHFDSCGTNTRGETASRRKHGFYGQSGDSPARVWGR